LFNECITGAQIMDKSDSGSKEGLWLGLSLAACAGISLCACICLFAASVAVVMLLPESDSEFHIEANQTVEVQVVEMADGTALPVQAKEGYLAPDFQLEALDEEQYALSDFSGQPVIVLYWASWCGYCKEELSLVQEMYPELEQQGIVVLAVNATDGDSLRDINRYVEEEQLPFPVLLDPAAKFNRAYGNLNSLPTAFFISSDGVVQAVVIGTMSEDAWRAQVADLQ
jgi:cytochrome c biogenesis protein CcmG/thiol:disulfide interchange protein DsbE